MIDPSLPFINAVAKGRASALDLDDYIAHWHEAPDDDPAADKSLHEFLGLTFGEYGALVTGRLSTSEILRSRNRP